MDQTPATVLRDWLVRQCPNENDWITTQLDTLSSVARERDLHMFLGFAPRRLGKADLELSAADLSLAASVRDSWNPSGWSVDGAARVLGLLRFQGKRGFADVFKDLRRTADASEMIALYRGLPLYPEPEALDFEVGEGLRSNLKPVFEAIAHNNPYPRDHFDDHRWNHMILKALFVGSTLTPVTGLEARANPELARILLDYAQERWAAGRPVTNDLWIPVRPFRDEPKVRAALDKAMAAGNLTEEMA